MPDRIIIQTYEFHMNYLYLLRNYRYFRSRYVTAATMSSHRNCFESYKAIETVTITHKITIKLLQLLLRIMDEDRLKTALALVKFWRSRNTLVCANCDDIVFPIEHDSVHLGEARCHTCVFLTKMMMGPFNTWFPWWYASSSESSDSD